jgi:hypothetical protein
MRSISAKVEFHLTHTTWAFIATTVDAKIRRDDQIIGKAVRVRFRAASWRRSLARTSAVHFAKRGDLHEF